MRRESACACECCTRECEAQRSVYAHVRVYTLSTHPHSDARIATLNKRVRGAGGVRVCACVRCVWARMCAYARECVSECVSVRACAHVRARVCVCVHVCMRACVSGAYSLSESE